MGCFASQVQSNVTILARGSCSVLLEMSFFFSALFPLCFCFIVFSALAVCFSFGGECSWTEWKYRDARHANVHCTAETFLQELHCLDRERKKEMQLQEANLNKLPLHLFQFTGGNIFLHII